MSTAAEVCFKYSTRDLVCDVIIAVFEAAIYTGKINAYDKIVIENQKKRKIYEIFYIKMVY